MAGVAVVHWSSKTPDEGGIPVVEVKKGDLSPGIYATGELRASHFSTLAAPQIGGGALQITRLLRTGTPVKKGDIVLEFDPSEQLFKMDQSRSEAEQADEEILKAKADAAVQAATDRVALLKARFEVRRAELEVGKNELVSVIDARKNELALEQARRTLAQLEQDTQSHVASGQAGIGVAQEKRHKASLAMNQAKDNIEKMKVRAPIDGIFAVDKNNLDFFFGMSLPDYHEGDQVNAGATVARIIEPAELEVVAKLDERERNNVTTGQTASITLDAMPTRTFAGTVKTVGGISSSYFFDMDPGKHFEVTIPMPVSDAQLRPGFTVQVVIAGEKRKNVLYVPRQAVFVSESKQVVYIRNGNDFEPREVKVVVETESQSAIEGVPAGSLVAFVNPTKNAKTADTKPVEQNLGPR